MTISNVGIYNFVTQLASGKHPTYIERNTFFCALPARQLANWLKNLLSTFPSIT